ncbi:ABC transporter G member 36 [Turnera subulata]|uniref:ABC transporter G member 36 n=1 Tax=Turnera subulata TaxID=218843 RepID=A0A9Q0JD72_9ROSI|nr:ABC transporter G member 36 [Turnera subulata]
MQLFIEEVMELVELNELRQVLVGLPGLNGLSMEQRKRLTIAVELVANPSILFMDEPTSGLDARAAAIVMRTVRNTVDTGRTVVCTIHQPSIDIFNSFDELFLLKKGGQEIYAGPIGHHSAHLIQYFEAIEGVNKIKDEIQNFTGMILFVISYFVWEPNGALVQQLRYYDGPKVVTVNYVRRNKAIIKELRTPAPDSKELYFPTRFSQSSFTQFKACLWKQRQSYWRNPPYTAVKFLFATTVALLFGSIYWELGSKMENRQDLFNALGSMYLPLLFIGFQTSTSVQPVVAVERTVFYRERAAGMYSPLPYAFAQILIELPYVFVQATLYGVIIYAMIGFEWTAAKFFWYLFFLYFTLLYFTFYGMMSVAVTPNQHISYIVSTMFYGIWNLFSGFVVPRPLIPIWWRWYYWTCPISWTLYGLLTSQYGNINDRRIETGQTVEAVLGTYFGYKYDFLGVVAAVVVGLGVLFALVFAFAIKKFNFQRR